MPALTKRIMKRKKLHKVNKVVLKKCNNTNSKKDNKLICKINRSELRNEIKLLKVIAVILKRCKNASSKKKTRHITSFMEVSQGLK